MGALLETTIPFGKYYGSTIADLPTSYVQWLLDNAEHGWVTDYRETLVAALLHVPEDAIDHGELAEDQSVASDKIYQTLIDHGEPLFRLQGASGYGKSFTAQDVAVRAKRAGHRVAACATSYVATQNLAKDLERLKVPCNTIARTLKLGLTYQERKEIYGPGVDTPEALMNLFAGGGVLIVDEYSMVEDAIGALLIEGAQQYGGRLLVIGDAHQLPSPAQDWDSNLTKVEPSAELWIPKRYSVDSDLYKIERTVRAGGFFDARNFAGSEEVSKVPDLAGLYRAYLDDFATYPDQQLLMLWYRRADMAAANQYLRRTLYGDSAPMIAPGERLRVQRTSNYLATPDDDVEAVRFYSGTTLTVENVYRDVRTINLPAQPATAKHPGHPGLELRVPALFATLKDYDMAVATMFSVTENQAQSDSVGAEAFNAAVRQVSDYCEQVGSWKWYHLFRNAFVQVAYQYSSTVHRVQGQSIDRVYTSPWALTRAQPFVARKLAYVGLTRAKQHLTVM
jgi:hypothetical protein